MVHLMEGVFNKRPSSRRSFPMWHPDDVFRPFSTWPRPFSVDVVLQRAAFLVAVAICRRLSELVSLRVDDNFLLLSDFSARFIPTRLSKTDRPNHMGPPIMVYSFPADPTLCPVEAVQTLVKVRHSLGLSHPYLFFTSSRPFVPLSIASFRGLIAAVLRQADIHAPPGTTRSASASAAFLGGAELADVLRAGDWTCAQTFFAHYCRDVGASAPSAPGAPSGSS